MSQASLAVSVPATTANLGPGYDFLGAALEWRDYYRALVSDELLTGIGEPQVTVSVTGHEASLAVPVDGSNLVAQSMLRALREWGSSVPATVQIECRNEIPHGRGLGSSSAAIVGGLGLAQAYLVPSRRPSLQAVLELAADIEGHPDNVAPAVLGGFTPTWMDTTGAHALGLQPHSRVQPVVAVPAETLATSKARGMMPAEVPLEDATYNASRAALLVWALTTEPEFLFQATADRIHQDRRAPAYPASHELVRQMRAAGHAAVISGAGPSVLVFALDDAEAVVDAAQGLVPQWDVRRVPFAVEGLVLESTRTG